MITITGSRGFLGQALSSAYAKQGESFCGYDYPFHTILDPDPWAPPIAKFDLEESIRDTREVVIHCAAIADLYQSEENEEKNERVNVEGTRNVAELCAKYNKLLIYISTCCVYGNDRTFWGKEIPHDGIITEQTKPRPTEVYAKSKLVGEKLIKKMPGLRYRICRIGTLYGVGMREALFNYVALKKFIDGVDPSIAPNGVAPVINIHGDGEQTRTYIYIDDVVSGIMTIVEKGSDGEVYNVAGNEEISVMETIKTASDIVAEKDKHYTVCGIAKQRNGQILKENIDSSKLKVLGWKPEVSYENGMRKSYEWMKGKK